MRYNPDAPYNILATDCIGFSDMQRVVRFARYWDLVANSGRFKRTLAVLLGEAPFANFMRFSDWLFALTGKTHEIALERLFDFIHAHLVSQRGIAPQAATEVLRADYEASGARGRPAFLLPAALAGMDRADVSRQSLRQARHLQN
jgi:hypothetical protein